MNGRWESLNSWPRFSHAACQTGESPSRLERPGPIVEAGRAGRPTIRQLRNDASCDEPGRARMGGWPKFHSLPQVMLLHDVGVFHLLLLLRAFPFPLPCFSYLDLFIFLGKNPSRAARVSFPCGLTSAKPPQSAGAARNGSDPPSSACKQIWQRPARHEGRGAG